MHSGSALAVPRKKPSFIEQARRRQIIEAAIDTIAAVGYANASFARIAAQAEISPSLISYHFRTRDELVVSVAQSIDADLRGWMAQAAGGATSHLDAARRIVTGFVRFVDRNRSAMLTLRQLDAGLSPAARAGVEALDPDRGIESWRDLLAAGQGAGEFRDFDARIMAAAVMGILGAVPRALFAAADIDVDRLADELATTVERAIAA